MQQAALERIDYFFNQANIIISNNPTLAHRYIEHARRLAMATKINIPPKYRHQICHHCKHWLKAGVNARYRLGQMKNYASYLAVTCLDCGHTTRYPYKGPACQHLKWISSLQPKNPEKKQNRN